MASYLVYDAATGLPLFVQQSRGPPTLPGEHAFIAVEDGTAAGRGDLVIDGALVRHVSTLDDNKAAQAAAAAGDFETRIAAGFTWSGALFQIDADSQARIAAMSIMALGSITDPANSPWPDGFYWVAADNSHVPMDAAAMYAFGRAAGAYVSACVLRLRAIKDAIAGAAYQAALDAIDVTAGYPAAG